jgi:hypothetical protein
MSHSTATAALLCVLLSILLGASGFSTSFTKTAPTHSVHSVASAYKTSKPFHQRQRQTQMQLQMAGADVVSADVSEDLSVKDVVDISAIKEGIKALTTLNGSDVRVGIIMARWNAGTYICLLILFSYYICLLILLSYSITVF